MQRIRWSFLIVALLGLTLAFTGSDAFAKAKKTGKKNKNAPPPADTTPITPTDSTPAANDPVALAQKSLDDLLAKLKTDFQATPDYTAAKKACDDAHVKLTATPDDAAKKAAADADAKLNQLDAKHEEDVAKNADVIAARKAVDDAKAKTVPPAPVPGAPAPDAAK